MKLTNPCATDDSVPAAVELRVAVIILLCLITVIISKQRKEGFFLSATLREVRSRLLPTEAKQRLQQVEERSSEDTGDTKVSSLGSLWSLAPLGVP